jgi:PAS domain S-box-containing protein
VKRKGGDAPSIARRDNSRAAGREKQVSPQLFEEREAEQQLLHDAAAILIQSITDFAIYMMDKAAHIRTWNSGAERIKGYTRDEIIGQHFSRFFTDFDRQSELPTKILRQAVADGKFEGEGWRVRKDGSLFWASVMIYPIYDDIGSLIGFAKVTRDVTEQHQAQDLLEQKNRELEIFAATLQGEERLRKLAVEELGHRLKNKIAMIQSIINYELRESPELRNEITHRLVALSRTDDLIMAMQGQGARLSDILSTELGPYGLSRITLRGPEFPLPPRLAWVMALIMHELATNAAKYGALSTAEGKLTIRWALKDRTLKLEWRESGGPLIVSPTRRGFGLRLLSHGLDQFAGAVETNFGKTGLKCTMEATIPEGAPIIIPEETTNRSGVFGGKKKSAGE